MAAGAAAVLLTACGGGVANDEGGQAAASGGAECGDTIKIGAPLPFSGPTAAFGNTAYNGMQVAVDQINSAGGIKALGGATLELDKADTSSSDTTQASSAATKLVSDGVVAMVGAWSTQLTAPIAPVAERAQVPLITQAWGDDLSKQGYKYFFQPSARSSQIGGGGAAALVKAAQEAGVSFRKVVAVAPNDAANVQQYNSATQAFTQAGAQASNPVFYQAGVTDVHPIVNEIQSANADLILFGGTPADATLIIKALRDAGVTAPMLSFGGAIAGTDPSFAKTLGDEVNGLIAVTAWNGDLKLDGVADAATQYVAQASASYMPDHAGVSWVSVNLIAQAMETSASCDPKKIADALHALDATSGAAAAMPGGEVSFTPEGTNPHAVPVVVQWQSGVPKTIYPSEYASAKLQTQ